MCIGLVLHNNLLYVCDSCIACPYVCEVINSAVDYEW